MWNPEPVCGINEQFIIFVFSKLKQLESAKMEHNGHTNLGNFEFSKCSSFITSDKSKFEPRNGSYRSGESIRMSIEVTSQRERTESQGKFLLNFICFLKVNRCFLIYVRPYHKALLLRLKCSQIVLFTMFTACDLIFLS